MNLPLSVWLLAVVVFVGLGLAAAKATRRLAELLLVVVPAAALAAFYLLLPSFTSIRFLIPVFALLALPVATALVHGVATAGARRRLVTGAIAVGLALHVAMMTYVAYRNFEGKEIGRDNLIQAAEAVRPLVERERCMVVGQEMQAAAYYIGCRVQGLRSIPEPQPDVAEAIETGWDVVAILRGPVDQGYVTTWQPLEIPGLPEGWEAFVPSR